MEELSRIDSIITYIKNKTTSFLNEDDSKISGVEASDISYDLKIDRANVSRTLNTLWKDGSLIKIAGRPVFYLDYKTVCDKYPDSFIPTYISTKDKLSNYYNLPQSSYDSNDPYCEITIEDYIGANGSLAKEIEKAKAAVCYPPYGLHTLITGYLGSGKTDLITVMMNYAIKQGAKEKDCPRFDIDCRNYYDNSSLLEDLLLGTNNPLDSSKNKKGLLSKATNGFIILEHIEVLPQASIELFVSLINKNAYTNRKTGKLTTLECMLILTTTTPLSDPTISSLSSYIPITITLTNIDERGTYEKLELIMDAFSKEAKSTNMPIKISKDVLLCLVAKAYPNNITQLENTVKSACSKAYMDCLSSYSHKITVSLSSLPSNILEMNESTIMKNATSDATMLLKVIPTDNLVFGSNGYCKEFTDFREFPYKSRDHLLNQFVEEFSVDVDSLTSIENYVYENINCLKNCGTIQLNALKRNIDPYVYNTVTTTIFQLPKFQNLKLHQELLYGILLHISNAIKRMKDNIQSKNTENSYTDKIYSLEYSIAEKIYSDFSKQYNFGAPKKEIDFLASYLAITNQYVNKKCVALLVIAHGKNTASDMVKYVKNNVHENFFIDSIDYNETMQLNDCIELACLKASTLNQGSGVLIITDMEPLISISEAIIKTCGIPSKSVYPLSLPELIRLAHLSSSSINDLDSLSIQKVNKHNYIITNDNSDTFIQNITEKIICKTYVLQTNLS